MLLTLALVILVGSIFVLFSQEFIRVFKKIFAIKGAKLILPLVIVSWLVYTFEIWCLWFLYYYSELLKIIVSFLTRLMPFQQGALSLVLIFVLTFISVVPVLLLDLFIVKKTYEHYQYPYLTSTLIWILSAMVSLMTF